MSRVKIAIVYNNLRQLEKFISDKKLRRNKVTKQLLDNHDREYYPVDIYNTLTFNRLNGMVLSKIHNITEINKLEEPLARRMLDQCESRLVECSLGGINRVGESCRRNNNCTYPECKNIMRQ